MAKTEFMRLAIQLAKAAKGQASPNPAVGAVVVKNGEIVGIGSHLKAGEPHAEVHALNMAGPKAEGSALFVTLEPCSHYGKTPPCTDLIIRRKIKRVVVAMQDPNPNVSGKGIEMLKNAGIEVEVGVCEEEAKELNHDFYHYMISKTPFVTLKTAISIDGKIATSTGESKWITSEEARTDVHRYRHVHDAILVGVGTVLKDNPKLTTRLPEGGKNPIRIILDRRLRTPLNSFVIKNCDAPTWLVVDKNAAKDRKTHYGFPHVKLIEMDNPDNLAELLRRLGELGITSLFVEGGAHVNQRFLTEKRVDQFIFYIAPMIIGGSDAPTCFEGVGIRHLKEAMKLKIQSIEQIGNDLKIIAQPRKE